MSCAVSEAGSDSESVAEGVVGLESDVCVFEVSSLPGWRVAGYYVESVC